MEDQLDLPLPLYKGRISQDWGAHEARLKAWLRVKGIPLHAREAADVLLLSLEPESHAALLFERALAHAQNLDFDGGATVLRTHFDTLYRKRLAQDSAQNALDLRTFRQRGRRNELVKDLVSDLEIWFEKAGVLEDDAKRTAFIKCFVEFPTAQRMLSKKETYHQVIAEALRWETLMVQQEAKATRPRPRAGERESSKAQVRSRPVSSPAPALVRVPSPIARVEDPTSLAPLSEVTSLCGPGSPSTIAEEMPEDRDVFDRPRISTLLPYHYPSASQFGTVSTSGGRRKGRGEGFESEHPPPRSQSVDLGQFAFRRELYEERSSVRSHSTPPFVSDALHSEDDNDDNEEETTGFGTEARAQPSPKRRRSKLVRKSSNKKKSHGGTADDVSLTASTSTITRRTRETVKGWFGKGTKHDPQGPRTFSSATTNTASREIVGGVYSSPVGRPAKVRGGGLAAP